MKAPAEFKVVCLRECVVPSPRCDTPAQVAAYWHANIPSAPWYDPCKEALVVFVLNVRRHILGHNLVALGTLANSPRAAAAREREIAGRSSSLNATGASSSVPASRNTNRAISSCACGDR